MEALTIVAKQRAFDVKREKKEAWGPHEVEESVWWLFKGILHSTEASVGEGVCKAGAPITLEPQKKRKEILNEESDLEEHPFEQGSFLDMESPQEG